MNREIKFRVWDNANEKIHLVNSIWGFPEYDHITVPFGEDSVSTLFNNFELMQYTGLKDSKGVEIYEGDQLSVCAGYSSTVEFNGGMFVSVYKHPEDGEVIPLLDAIGKDTIVIGNIYQT